MEGLISEFGPWGLIGAGVVVFLFIYGFTSKGGNTQKHQNNSSNSSSSNSGGDGGSE